MASSGMLRRVALVRTDISEELSASFIRVTNEHLVFLRSVRRLLVRTSVVPSSCYVRFEVFTAVTVKNASQETHYVSATESSQLMHCKI
jgi:hypothetical protein